MGVVEHLLEVIRRGGLHARGKRGYVQARELEEGRKAETVDIEQGGIDRIVVLVVRASVVLAGRGWHQVGRAYILSRRHIHCKGERTSER